MMGLVGGVLGRMFGTAKAVDNLLDKDNGLLVRAGSWVGGMNYTDQERAEHNLVVRDFGLKQLEALTPFKVMQRIMVSIIAVQWAVLFNCILVCICLKHHEQVQQLTAFAVSEYAWYPMGAAVTLYLAGGVWKGGPR